MSNWFGPKRLGWGVGPRSWQGWLVTLAYLAAMMVVARQHELTAAWRVGTLAALTAALLVIIALTYSRGEKQ